MVKKATAEAIRKKTYKKEKDLAIGTKVFIINQDCEIEEKTILGYIEDEDGKRYRLMEHGCDGMLREHLFLKQSLADKELHSFIRKLKYTIGDVCIYEDEENRRKPSLARIMGIKYSDKFPYKISFLSGWSSPSIKSVMEESLTKIHDDYIENYEDIKEIVNKMVEIEKEYSKLNRQLNYEFDKLDKFLVKSFMRMNSWRTMKKSKFEDRFELDRDDY